MNKLVLNAWEAIKKDSKIIQQLRDCDDRAIRNQLLHSFINAELLDDIWPDSKFIPVLTGQLAILLFQEHEISFSYCFYYRINPEEGKQFCNFLGWEIETLCFAPQCHFCRIRDIQLISATQPFSFLPLERLFNSVRLCL